MKEKTRKSAYIVTEQLPSNTTVLDIRIPPMSDKLRISLTTYQNGWEPYRGRISLSKEDAIIIREILNNYIEDM